MGWRQASTLWPRARELKVVDRGGAKRRGGEGSVNRCGEEVRSGADRREGESQGRARGGVGRQWRESSRGGVRGPRPAAGLGAAGGEGARVEVGMRGWRDVTM